MTREEIINKIRLSKPDTNNNKELNEYFDRYDKKLKMEAVEEYKKALITILEEENCIHVIDLDIEASKLVDGF